MNIQSLLLDTIHHTSEGITLADVNHDEVPLIFANDAFCRMTGYESEEVLGRNCRFLQGKETSAETVEQIRQCLEDRAVGIFEIYNYRKDGSGFWNRLSLAPVFKDNKPVCYAGIQSDITVYKEAKSMMENHHQNLIKMIGMVSGDMRQTLKEMSSQLDEKSALYDSTKYLLHQLSLLVTMIETNSSEIMDFVKTQRSSG